MSQRFCSQPRQTGLEMLLRWIPAFKVSNYPMVCWKLQWTLILGVTLTSGTPAEGPVLSRWCSHGTCEWNLQLFVSVKFGFFPCAYLGLASWHSPWSHVAPVCLTMFLQTLALVWILWENTMLLVCRQVPSQRYLHLHPAPAVSLQVLKENMVPVWNCFRFQMESG